MAKATAKKFKPPVMTRRGGGKNTDHSAASGWIDKVVSAVKAGTPAELKRHPIAYHGNPPHVEDAPVEPRPSVAPTEPQDVPGADDMTRKIDPTPYPTTHGHKPRAKSGTVPATCGACAAPTPKEPC
jgi:hypothetical protein